MKFLFWERIENSYSFCAFASIRTSALVPIEERLQWHIGRHPDDQMRNKREQKILHPSTVSHCAIHSTVLKLKLVQNSRLVPKR